jgi:flagellar export protein FliJ
VAFLIGGVIVRRFQFRLERVLSLKEQRERLAEMRQQQAAARLEEARSECVRIEEQLAATTTRAAEKLREAAVLGTWQAHYEQAVALGEMLAAAQGRASEAETLLQEANRLRIQAALEVETLRGLRAREWENYRKDAARQQQNNLDELGMQRWMAAQGAGPFGSPAAAEGDGS